MVNRHVVVTPSFIMQMLPEIVLQEIVQEPGFLELRLSGQDGQRHTKVHLNGRELTNDEQSEA